jgi:Rrf2 family protein
MLSKKTQYALKAVSYLAGKYKDGAVQIAEIAEHKKIPLKFLESILLELKKAGILDSKKGKGGGYFFEKDPATISVAKVVRTIDGPISMMPCVSLYFFQKCEDCDQKHCRINSVFAEARDATLSILENRSVMDI